MHGFGKPCASPEPQPALCAVCGNPQDEHGGPLYAHRYVAPQPATAESPWTVADEALQPEPPASPRPQGGEPQPDVESAALLLDTALRLLLHDIRDLSPDEPPERSIPTHHRVQDIRQARAALAKRSEPAQDFRISPDPREDEF